MPRVKFVSEDGEEYGCTIPSAIYDAVEFYVSGSCGSYYSVYIDEEYIGKINNPEDFEREFRVHIR